MKNFLRSLSLVLLIPSVAAAAVQSENFALDDMTFGSVNTLATDKSGIPPAISSDGPNITALTATSATIEWKTDKVSTSFVSYGTDRSVGKLTGIRDAVTVHTVTLTGLSEQTQYYYRVESEDVYGSRGTSSVYSFSTPAETSFREVSVSQITYDSALIKVVSGGLTSLTVKYSETSSFTTAKEAVTSSLVVESNFPLTGLKEGTKYFLLIEGKDTAGQTVSFRGLTFITKEEPQFAAVAAEAVSANEILLTVDTNTPTSLAIEYQSAKDADLLTATDTSVVANHLVRLRKLYGSTVYSIKVTATDEGGRRVSRDGITATTSADTSAPEVSVPTVSVVKNGTSISVTARWEASEPVKAKLRLRSTVNSQEVIEVPETSSYNTAAIMVANGLKAKTPYVLEAISTDSSGNTVTKEVSLVTPSIRKSVLELITENLAKVIEPLSRLVDSI